MEELILEDAGGLIKIIENLSKKGVIKDLNKLTNSAVINSLWSLVGGSRWENKYSWIFFYFVINGGVEIINK